MPRVVLTGGAYDGEEHILSSLAPLPLEINRHSVEKGSVAYYLLMKNAQTCADKRGCVIYAVESLLPKSGRA